jgi:hypothetical protein
MGMSKSGTTLVSKTLHESGINMHPGKTGNYKQSKYEDPAIIKILLQMFETNRLQSLFIPNKIKWTRKIRDQIKRVILHRSGNWGFKQPWLTLVYPEFKNLLPPHIAIGIKRSFKGLVSHWTKRGRKVNEKKLYTVWNLYNMKMELYDIPVISFEYFIKHGPGQLEKVIGRKLKDVRV